MSSSNRGRDQIRQALRADLAKPLPVCVWTYEPLDDAWDSACGEKWQFLADGPVENKVRFCHGCGRPVKVRCRG